jgi:hypothetical protein
VTQEDRDDLDRLAAAWSADAKALGVEAIGYSQIMRQLVRADLERRGLRAGKEATS